MTGEPAGRDATDRPADQPTEREAGRDRGWQPRRRPPWWPDNEPWPPTGRPWQRGPWGHGPWGRRPSRIARGFGCLFGVLFLFGLVGLLGLVASAVAAAGPLGDAARVGGLAVLIIAAVGIVAVGRAMRRAAGGLDAIADAADRVEAGDLAIRVREPTGGPYPIRQLARRFNAMVARLEADATQRRTLLADVSHELRTPLAVVQGNVEAILDGVHPADEAHLAAILEEIRVLSRLVDDLRTVTLSESGSVALHREPTDLAIVIEDVAASFRSTAATAGVELGVSVNDDLPLLDIDPIRIREVLVNLVANALRHTPSGGTVRIEAAATYGQMPRASPEAGEVVLTVTDTGGGIEPALLPKVFDRFAKGAESRGSGLGLAIARSLVEAHGGTIQVTSEIGRGTAFTVRLPDGPRSAD